ncbi:MULTISPECIES: hypothetical protein [unclassified Vibrio]|uniref:Transposase n=1 Tax=Vibrio sp. HB236076 TaxID=3232307 RepID=A0AB39HK42_9VIBR|nr:hypothetical protein [Vibrio sp. HB161653]MDP5252900.1 hypothetical protein [Vibrio sp. HB161653]
MLLDFVTQSVRDFQRDCLVICQNHYPAVHNKGINQHHLAKAFSRRMKHTLDNFQLPCQIAPLETSHNSDTPHQYRVTCSLGTVWIIAHHMVSGGGHYREKLIGEIHQWQAQYQYAIQPNDLLFLISDHWINRGRTSREMIHWWLNRLPDNLSDYQQQGVHLIESSTGFDWQLNTRFGISPCYVKIGHPLQSKQKQQPVYKYLQMYKVLQWAQ